MTSEVANGLCAAGLARMYELERRRMRRNSSQSLGGKIDPGGPWQLELPPSGLGFFAQMGVAAALGAHFAAPPARIAAAGMAAFAAALIGLERPLAECARVLAHLPWERRLAAPTPAPLVEAVAILLRAEHTQETATPLELWALDLSTQRLAQLDGPFSEVLAACSCVPGCHTPHRWRGSAWCSAGWAGLAAGSAGSSGGSARDPDAPLAEGPTLRIVCRCACEAPVGARRAAWRAWESAPLVAWDPTTIAIDWPGQPDDPALIPDAYALGVAAGRAWLEANAS